MPYKNTVDQTKCPEFNYRNYAEMVIKIHRREEEIICLTNKLCKYFSVGPTELFGFDWKLWMEFIAVRLLHIFSADSNDSWQMFST